MAGPTYTRAQANEMLPWLAERLRRLADAASELRKAQNTVESLIRRARGNGHSDMSAEMGEAERAAAGQTAAVRDLLEEIGRKGIQVRDVGTGLVDFPGERDGQPIWLCWRLGEQDVAHWHEHDTGFSSRKPLDEQ